MKINKKWLIFIFVLSLIGIGCKKYLETKPDSRLAVPTTKEDLQAMLDTYYKMSEQESALGENCSDNYFLSSDLWAGLPTEDERNLYIWDKNVLFNNPANDWYNLYEKINYCNAVIEAYDKMSQDEKIKSSDVLGQALFFRATSFLSALTIWAKTYHPETSKDDLGIPLRLNTNFNEKTTRASVKDGYEQVISDLTKSAGLLTKTPIHVIRPSKQAAYGYLSRTYLMMGEFQSSFNYADSCLKIKNDLLDYNNIDLEASLPFPRFNKEVIFELASGSTSSIFFGNIDTLLYKDYELHDLRKRGYFSDSGDGTYKYKGSYESHNSMLFWGLASDEMYLNRAECNARLQNLETALLDLNYLRINRIDKEHYAPFFSSNQQDILDKILSERRKELLFRGLRWSDIKRLNRIKPAINLIRKLGAKTYTLPPNDPKFALPIPESVINLSGIQQN